jgi:hypothetical protein
MLILTIEYYIILYIIFILKSHTNSPAHCGDEKKSLAAIPQLGGEYPI